jgi:hypothetical protein
VENIWTLKAVLRGFELASGLKVNFWKSCLIGVNVSNDFMDMAATFLNCRRSNIPFKYLGLPVGASPRRMSTWEPLLVSIRKKLNSWSHKHVSFGGRLVLINSVLNSIPIFYLSFLKMPEQVVKKITRIQREFLWGGVNGGKKVCWVKWKVVCRDKKSGGLGVRNIKIVNYSLLMKWRWRLLQLEERGLWKDVIIAKYGDHVTYNAGWSGASVPYFASLWWKDICNLEGCVVSKNWVEEGCIRRLGNGNHTRFWSDIWIDGTLLSVKFPRLFSLSLQKEAKISDLVVLEEDSRVWNFRWRRRLFHWEEECVSELLDCLGNVTFQDQDDSWRWDLTPEG